MYRKPQRCRQHVSQVIAAEQLIKESAEVHTRTSIKFLFTHSRKTRRHERRVEAAQLIDEEINPDCKKYLFLLYSSAARLLSFAGYTIKSICETVTGHGQKNLADYWKKGDEMQPSNSSRKNKKSELIVDLIFYFFINRSKPTTAMAMIMAIATTAKYVIRSDMVARLEGAEVDVTVGETLAVKAASA